MNSVISQLQPAVAPALDGESVAGRVLWIDASDTSSFTLSGTTVTSITDKSGSGATMDAPIGTITWAATSVNGRPAFNLTSGRVRGGFSTKVDNTLILGYRHTAFVVAVADTAPINGGTLMALTEQPDGSGVYYKVLEYVTTPQFRTLATFSAGTRFTQIDSPPIGTPFVLSEFFDGSFQPNTMRSFLNGGSSTPSATGTSSITTDPDFFVIGTTGAFRQGTTNEWPGKICEIIVINRVVPPDERLALEKHLAVKWGLNTNLVPDHPYKTRFPISQSFNPVIIPACALWLDADDQSTVSTSGTSITQWRDKSGNGFNTTSIGSATYVQSGLNGRPCVSNITNVTGRVLSPEFVGVSIFVVASVPAVRGTNSGLLALNDNVQSTASTEYSNAFRIFVAYRANTSPPVIYGRMGGVDMSLAYAGVFNQPMLWTGFKRGALAQTFGNGTEYPTTAVNANTPSYFSYWLGGPSPNGPTWPGMIGEIIIYNRLIRLPERQQIEGYLSRKWGLLSTFPALHPFKTLPPRVTVFIPTNLDGCLLWFDAADTSSVTGTNPVTAWANRGSIATTATVSAGTTTYNTDAIGRRFLRMPTGSALQFSAVLNSQPRTWFAVVRNTTQIPNAATPLRITNPNTTGQGSLTVLYVSATQWRLKEEPLDVSSKRASGLVPNSLNTIELYSLVHSTTVARSVVSRNGTSTTVGGSQTAAGYNITTNLTYQMPSTAVGCEYFEVLFYAQALSPGERQRVEGYLAHKWGLVGNLPDTHAYKKFRP
jgi:hypothetical protein